MATTIKTTIIINAATEKVWAILTNFENYPNWNPFIKSIKGAVKVGNKITVTIAPPESKGVTFKPRVLTFEAGKELSWLGQLLFTGLFDGEHKFELIDNGNATTTFIQSEKFSGILISFFKKELENNTQRGFQEMNKELKELTERI